MRHPGERAFEQRLEGAGAFTCRLADFGDGFFMERDTNLNTVVTEALKAYLEREDKRA
jgi:hypothetical protein